MLKTTLKRALASLGLEVSRVSPQPSHESKAFQALHRLLGPRQAPIIFDVGAHNGEVSRDFRKTFPQSTVYSFEPFPASFELLRANTAEDQRIRPFPFGLSNRAGSTSFHSNAHAPTNSLLPTASEAGKIWGEDLLTTNCVIEAQFRTIDDVMEELGLTRIDLLKLDVQGAEHLVLEGASGACARGAIDVIFSEIIVQPTYEGQLRLDEALHRYHGCGFEIYNLYNLSVSDDGRLRQMDVIFTRK